MNSDTDADADTDSDADNDSDVDSDADSDSDADADTDTDVDADADTGADTNGDADADTDADSDTDTDSDTESVADTETDTIVPCPGRCVAQGECLALEGTRINGASCPADTPVCCEIETVGSDTDTNPGADTDIDADSDSDSESGADTGEEPDTDPDSPKYPFPQSVKYPFGVYSAKISNDFVKKWYESWRTTYLQECNGNLRPGVDPLTKSLVEAQGFAMIAAAYMGDKEVVDKLYNYYKAKCTNAGCGLMGWKQTCDGWEDQGSATDGDIDVASGLVVANWQWPDRGYDEKAKGVLSNLKRMIANCSGKSAIYPGCSNGGTWGGCNETDISYYSPAFFRYFAELTGDSAWTKLADDTHAIRDAAANPSTGLVPDWQSVSGTAGAGSRKGYFSFDAIRAPYKLSIDYLWNGIEEGRAWSETISTWAYGVGVANIKDEYNLNGTVVGDAHSMAVVGSLAVAAMANTQEIIDAFAEETLKLTDVDWYSGYLGNLYLLALSGNLWNPDIVDNKR